MQKNFTQLITHFLSAKRYTVPAGAFLMFLATSLYVWAAVGVTVTGGTTFPISADLAANATQSTPGFTSIGEITVTENLVDDIKSTGNLILRAPAGWRFGGTTVTATAGAAPGETRGNIKIAVGSATVSQDGTQITIPITDHSSDRFERIIIQNVQVQALNGSNIPGTGSIVLGVGSNTTITGLSTQVNTPVVSLSQQVGAAKKLTFITQPSLVETGAPITPAPQVAIQDQFGNTVSTATNTVAIAIGTNPPGNGVLTPGTATSSNGVVTFTGASVNTAGVGYTLVASSSGLTSATSTAFTVNNLRPVITDVVECVTVGDPETTVTVTGSNFVSGATVTFDGVTRAATFVNSTTLTTVLTTADLSSVRDVNVTVNNPLPASNNGVSAPIVERVRALFSFPIEGPNAICASTLNSSAFTVQTGPNISSYLWTVASGDARIVSGGTTGNPRIDFGAPGQVVLSVVQYNLCGKPGPAATKTVTVNPLPEVVLSASKTDICAGESVKLSASGAGAYVWSGGAIPSGTTGEEVTVSPTTSTTYTVVGTTSYTVDGVTTSCSTTKSVTINVTPALTQGEITGATQLCQNQAVAAASALTATITGGVSTKTYLWEQSPTGLEGTWSSVATTATYAPSTATAGTVYYRRTVNSGSCSVTSDPVAVTVTPAIVDNTIATPDQNVCSGKNIPVLDGATATAGSQQVTYLWEQSTTGTGNWTAAVGASGNTGEDFQPDTRTVTSSNTIYYRRTVNSGNCTSSSNIVSVTVNPLPEATITQGQFTYFCSPGTALLSATEVAGASYTWFRAEASGPVEVANTRTTNVGVVGTYYVVVKYDATTCESTSATISVQETVVGNNIVGINNGNQEICYNTIPLEIAGSTATSTVGPVTYQWEVSTDNTTFTALTGATDVNLTQAQLGAHTSDRWYRRKAIVGSCTNLSTETVRISVKPELLLTSESGPAVVEVICSGATFSYTPTSNAPAGSTLAWSRATVTGISNPATSGEGAISEELVNTTPMPLQVTYVYKITTPDNCESALQYVNVGVNPSPVLSNTTTEVAVCSNAPFTYTATTATTSSPAPTFAWTRAAVVGISNAAASGDGATINETLVNTTNAPVDVTYLYTITANGCAGSEQSVVVSVNPTPTVNAIANATYCNGAPGAAISFGGSVIDATYTWSSSDNVGFGTGGTGNIGAFTAVNTSNVPVVATVTVTAKANGCEGPAQTFTVTVNPTPTVNAIANATYCNGAPVAAISFGSPVNGTTYTWTSSADVGFGTGSSTSPATGIPAYTASNTGTTAVTATVTVTPSANGCPGTPMTFTVTVNPNQPVSFTGDIASTNTFYTGQGTVALSASPTGGTFSGPGVSGSTFNPCAAGAGQHTVTYTRGTGSCTSTVSKTVTVLQSTYKAVVTSSFKPFCRGDNVTHTARVWRDAEVIYPYLTNAAGDPVRADGSLVGPQELPVANPNYEFPAGTPEGIKLVAWRYFNPIVKGGVEVTTGLTYQWTKNQENEIGADGQTFSNAGLSSLDYYAAFVTVGGGACGPNFTNRISSRTYTAEQANYSMTISAAPQPVCQGAPVTLTATLNSAFSFWSQIGLKLQWNLIRDKTTIPLGSTTYTGNSSALQLVTSGPDGGFINGDKVSILFTSDLDSRDIAGTKCAGGKLSDEVTLVVNDIAALTPTDQSKTICLGAGATFNAPVTTTGPATVNYVWNVGGTTYNTVVPTLTLTSAQTMTPGSFPVSVVVSNACETTTTLALGTLTVRPALAVFTVGGGGSYCQGSPVSYPITLSGSETGVNYTLLRGTTTVQTLAGTGSSLSFTATSTAGTYTVQAIYATTPACGPVTMTGSAAIIQNPLPTVTVTSPTVCQGETATVTATPAGGSGTYTSYTWTVPSGWTDAVPTTASFTTTVPGTYTVKVTDDRSCTSSAAATSTVTVNPRPTVTVTSPTVCQGETATVTATPAGGTGPYTYTWTNLPAGVTNPGNVSSFTTSVDGTYTVSITDSKNCASSATATSTVMVKPILSTSGTITSDPAVPEVNKPVTFTANSNVDDAGEAESYKWYISTETGTDGEPNWVLQSGESGKTFSTTTPNVDFLVRVDVIAVAGACYTSVPITTQQIKPLPVEILYLNASKQGNDVLLEWATASEQDNKGFEVQVSKDGLNYRLLTFVPSRNGNSNTKQVYAFTDKENGKDGTRYYRLKQIDHAGTFEFFGPKVVTFGAVASKVIAFPNPFSDEITLDIASETEGEMLVVVTDAVGKQLMQRKVKVERGFTTEKLKLGGDLPRGLYIIKTQIGGYTQFIKMIKE